MQKELKVEGFLYLTMKDGENEEQAKKRFEELLDKVNIIQGDCTFEEQEV